MCFGNICLHSGLCGWLSIKQSVKKSPLLSLNQRSLLKTLIWFGFEGPVSTLISTFDVLLLCVLYNGGQPYLKNLQFSSILKANIVIVVVLQLWLQMSADTRPLLWQMHHKCSEKPYVVRRVFNLRTNSCARAPNFAPSKSCSSPHWGWQ